jgi:hypothetical protein
MRVSMAVGAIVVAAALAACTDGDVVPSVPQPALYTVESNAYMDALADGTLRERHGCLFLDPGVGGLRLFILPAGEGFELRSDGVLLRNGQPVADIGSEIEAGGGIVKGTWLAPQVTPTLPEACVTSRAWLASPEVRSLDRGTSAASITMPDVQELDIRTAIREIEELGLVVSTIRITDDSKLGEPGAEDVVGQEPAPGAEVERGSQVALTVTAIPHSMPTPAG